MKPADRIRQIHRYIHASGMSPWAYDFCELDPEDLIAIAKYAAGSTYVAAIQAFAYGMSKGYRAGRSEARRHG